MLLSGEKAEYGESLCLLIPLLLSSGGLGELFVAAGTYSQSVNSFSVADVNRFYLWTK